MSTAHIPKGQVKQRVELFSQKHNDSPEGENKKGHSSTPFLPSSTSQPAHRLSAPTSNLGSPSSAMTPMDTTAVMPPFGNALVNVSQPEEGSRMQSSSELTKPAQTEASTICEFAAESVRIPNFSNTPAAAIITARQIDEFNFELEVLSTGASTYEKPIPLNTQTTKYTWKETKSQKGRQVTIREAASSRIVLEMELSLNANTTVLQDSGAFHLDLATGSPTATTTSSPVPSSKSEAPRSVKSKMPSFGNVNSEEFAKFSVEDMNAFQQVIYLYKWVSGSRVRFARVADVPAAVQWFSKHCPTGADIKFVEEEKIMESSLEGPQKEQLSAYIEIMQKLRKCHKSYFVVFDKLMLCTSAATRECMKMAEVLLEPTAFASKYLEMPTTKVPVLLILSRIKVSSSMHAVINLLRAHPKYPKYGLFHSALRVGSAVVDWNSSSLCIPRKYHEGSRGAFIEIPICVLDTSKAKDQAMLNKIRKVISNVAVKFNTTQRYGVVSCSCQTFESQIMAQCGLSIPQHSVIKSYLAHLKQNGLDPEQSAAGFDIKWFHNDVQEGHYKILKTALKESLKCNQTMVYFCKHSDVSRYIRLMKQYVPQFETNHVGEHLLLQGFCKAFQLRYMKAQVEAVQDFMILSQLYGGLHCDCAGETCSQP